MPADATYLQEGYKSKAIIDYLWPFKLRIKVGSSSVILVQ